MERLAITLPRGAGDPALHFGSRRAASRFPLHGEVRVEAPRAASGITINASSGGMRIAVDVALTAGELVQVRVTFPSGAETIEHARVVWVKCFPDGCVAGLEFVKPH